MVSIKTFEFNLLHTNCYIVSDEDNFAAIVDPCYFREDEKKALNDYISAKGLKVDVILVTHGHFDHVYGVADCAKTYPSAKVYYNSAEEKTNEESIRNCPLIGLDAPDYSFAYEDVRNMNGFDWHSRTIKILHTPGHTEGGVCYFIENDHILFSGDTLFKGTIGRTDMLTGNYDDIMESLMKVIMVLPSDTDVLPGHGPATTIADEALTNPMLQPIDEFLESEE